MALVASLQVLLPGTAHAHEYGPPGLGGAQVTVSDDGYVSAFMGHHPKRVRVSGKGFAPLAVAQVFQCPEDAADLHRQCQLAGTAATDQSGVFKTEVREDSVGEAITPLRGAAVHTAHLSGLIFTAEKPAGVGCLGGGYYGSPPPAALVQCSVVAATFDSDLQPTARAEHLICMASLENRANCKPRPPADTPNLSVGHVSVTEGNAGTTNANFNLALSAPLANPLTVDYTTTNATATAPSDYSARSGTLTIPAGTTTATVSVPVNGDTSLEADERFFLDLSNLSAGAVFAHPRAQATIVSDDAPPATLSVNDVEVRETVAGATTQAIFTVRVSKPYPVPFSVRAFTADGTAHPAPHESNDYVQLNQTINFAAGETSKQVAVTVNGDNVAERDEVFYLALEDSTGPQRAKRQGVGTIFDDDNFPTVSIDDVTLAEGHSGTTEARFTVALSHSSFRDITVGYATSDGTARGTNHGIFGPADYVPAMGTLSFAPGETTKTVVVLVNGDRAIEANEEFLVQLPSAVNTVQAKRVGKGTIRNDD